MRIPILIISCLLLALAAPTKAAFVGGGAVYGDNEDVVFSWEWSSGGNTFTHHLRRFQDLNSDGDFLDANENVLVTAACGGIALSCLIGTAQHNDPANVIIFRNGSSEHRPGNYTLRAELQNAIGTPLDSVSFGFRIVPTLSQVINVEITSQAESTRTLMNTTKEELQVDLTGIRANLSHENVHSTVGQNLTVTFHGSASPATNQFDLSLRRLRDLNSDGDYADAAENLEIVSLSNVNTCATVNAHLSCRVDFSRQSVSITWKGTSSEQIVGDYWLDYRWKSPAGNELSRHEAGIRLVEESFSPGQHEATRALVNQSYANLTTNGVPCSANCSTVDNVTINETSLLSKFTQDCHSSGDKLCVNGHEVSFIDAELGRILALLAIMVIVVWLAVGPGVTRPLTGFFIGLAAFFFLLSHQDFLQSGIVTRIFTFGILIPWSIAGVRGWMAIGKESGVWETLHGKITGR